MSLVRSLTFILLASVSFNMVPYSGYSMDGLDGVQKKAIAGGKSRTQPAPQEVKSKKKEGKKTDATVQPSDSVDDQEEDEIAVPAPAHKVIDDEAVTLDRDGAVDDKREEQTPPVAVDIVSALTSLTPVPDGEKKEEKDKSGQTPAPSGEEDTHLSDDDEAELLNAPTPPAEKEEEKPFVSSAAATSKPYQPIIDRLVGESRTYTDARSISKLLYTIPTQINFLTFSETPDTEFNTLFREVADEFYTLYGSEDEGFFSQAKERVMVWISQKILQMTEQQRKLEEDQEKREDGSLGYLKDPATKLEEHIATYELLFKETLYHMNETRSFVQYILNAIKDTRASIDALKDMLLKETSGAIRTSHEAGISKLSRNIEKFQSWLLSSEAVTHTLYPFHRERSYLFGVVPLPQLGQKSLRREITGVINLPPSLTLTADYITDSKIDKHQNFKKYMQAMLSLNGVMYTQAKDQKRLTEIREDK